MSREHKNRLKKLRTELVEVLIMDQLVDDLLSASVITRGDKSNIDSCKTKDLKAGEFLDLLNGKADSAYYSFIEVLDKQSDENRAYGIMADKLKDWTISMD